MTTVIPNEPDTIRRVLPPTVADPAETPDAVLAAELADTPAKVEASDQDDAESADESTSADSASCDETAAEQETECEDATSGGCCGDGSGSCS